MEICSLCAELSNSAIQYLQIISALSICFQGINKLVRLSVRKFHVSVYYINKRATEFLVDRLF
jgi:hypothetical protein